MAVTTLKQEAERLAASSKFTGGNPLSFKITLDEGASLPGRYDPAEYLDGLGLTNFSGMTVVIVCAGNGGLVAEAIKRGAKLALSCEPRFHYHQSLPVVLGMISKPEGVKTGYLPSWPRGDEQADLVIWPDGLQDSRHPRMILRKVFSMLKPGGAAYIEAVIGGMNKPGETVNTWKPTQDALESTLLDEAPEFSLEKVGPGRLTNRVIYRVCEPTFVVVEALGGPEMTTLEDVIEVQEKIKAATNAAPKKKAAKKAKAAKKPRKKRATKKEKTVMNLTRMTLLAVRAEVALWGEKWLDQVINEHAKEEKGVKAPPRLRGTTSDNIGFSPIPEK
jgi:hypothetical protein